MITGSSSQRVALLHCIEGPTSSEALIASLTRVVEEQGAMLVAARADEEERTLNRRLREEQDAAYEASVQADRVSRKSVPLAPKGSECFLVTERALTGRAANKGGRQ